MTDFLHRRTFLQRCGLGAGALCSGPVLAPRQPAPVGSAAPEAARGPQAEQRAPIEQLPPLASDAGERRGEMLFRKLGRTNESVSLLGLGGFHIGIPKDDPEAIRLIRTAIDRGVTFMDNCWDYHDGRSEQRMGRALRDGYRERVFLMTKFDGRTKLAAAKQIDESLRRLQTDRIDLMQVHEVIRLEDPDRCFGELGAIEALDEAQKVGKVRYVGFTGHKDPSVHLRMLDAAAAHGFRFDAVQLPLNVMDAHFRSFGTRVLPRLVSQEIGVLGMKPIGAGEILASRTVNASDCLRFAMSLATSTVISGIESSERLEQALKVVAEFEPMSSAQIVAMLGQTRAAALTGRHEKFKTDITYDSTAKNPQWLG